MAKAGADAFETISGEIANGTVQEISADDGDTRDADKACGLQAGLREVRVCLTNHLIHFGHLVMKAGGDHTDEPVIVSSRQRSQDKRRPQLARSGGKRRGRSGRLGS